MNEDVKDADLDGGAKNPELAHLLHDLPVEGLVPIGEGDPGHELLLAVVVEDVPHHHLLLGEPALQVQGVLEVKLCLCCDFGFVSDCHGRCGRGGGGRGQAPAPQSHRPPKGGGE